MLLIYSNIGRQKAADKMIEVSLAIRKIIKSKASYPFLHFCTISFFTRTEDLNNIEIG